MRRLAARKRHRDDERRYVIEGITLVRDAFACGVDVEEVLLDEAAGASLRDEVAATAAAVRIAPAGALARAVSTVTPQPIAAVAVKPDDDVGGALACAATMALVLVGVGDPGNAGTLLRTAEAAGAGAVLFCDGSVDPYNPKCVRSSAGSLFRVRVATGEAVEVLDRCEAAGLTRVATAVRGAPEPERVDLRSPFALVLGSEAHGLPEHLRAQVDLAVTLPMAGRTESLNVAMAGAVVCFEALRQRRAG